MSHGIRTQTSKFHQHFQTRKLNRNKPARSFVICCTGLLLRITAIHVRTW